jgi:hypothetical protein
VLLEHDHRLAAYCATCERWAVLDLERLIAAGRGDYCFVGRTVLASAAAWAPGNSGRRLSDRGLAAALTSEHPQ